MPLGFHGYCAQSAVIDASAAARAEGFVDARHIVLHRDRIDRAGIHTYRATPALLLIDHGDSASSLSGNTVDFAFDVLKLLFEKSGLLLQRIKNLMIC